MITIEGNLIRDNSLMIVHKAFGYEAAVYIKRRVYSSYDGFELVDVDYFKET